MQARPLLIAAILAVSACATTTTATTSPAGQRGADRLARMSAMAQSFHEAEDVAERRALMLQHMTLMHEQMAETGAMMGGGMRGGQGMMADSESDMAAMHERMAMMHQMMMQMMAQQDMMLEMSPGANQDAGEAQDEDDHSAHHD